MAEATRHTLKRCRLTGPWLGPSCSPDGAARARRTPIRPEVRVYRLTGSRIAIGRSVVIERDEEVRDAVFVVGG